MWRSFLLALSFLIASTVCHADVGSDWLRARLAEAVTLATSWGVNSPVVLETDTDYVEVAADGRIYIGRPLVRRLMARADADAVGRFLLLHELRHVYQRQKGQQAAALTQECDADYFAVLQISRADLAKVMPSDRTGALALVLVGQDVAVRANALAVPGASGIHLDDAKRLRKR